MHVYVYVYHFFKFLSCLVLFFIIIVF